MPSQILLIIIAILLAVSIFFLRRLVLAQEKAKESGTEHLQQTQQKIREQWDMLQRLSAMLTTIHEAGASSGAGTLSRKDLAKIILDNACTLTQTDQGSLFLVDQESFDLILAAHRGFSQEVTSKSRLKSGQGITGQVAQAGKPVIVNAGQSPAASEVLLAPHEQGSFMAIPLRVKNRAIGVLTVNAPSHRVFQDKDLQLVIILGDQAAMMLENVELYENLQDFYFQLVQALVRAIDAKDSYTYERADRARYLARSLSERFHLPEQIIRYVEYAALMHDIGKVGISEELLHKSGPLTPEEYEILKKHPTIGNRIIAPVSFLSPVGPMILYHQEWYNGQGYPEGLVGEEIPLGSRIVAIIDAWDGMTCDRPYRKALSKEAALAEIRRGSGTQFDPKVVQAFLDVVADAEQKGIPVTEGEFLMAKS